MQEPIKKIVIVGRDADAWLTALMLQLSFVQSERSVDVHLIELPSVLTPHDVYSVLPSHKILHKVMGMDEGILFRKASAQYSLGQQFTNWSDKDSHFFHGYDTHGINLQNVEFFQYWIKAYHNGLNIPLEAFSLGVEAAKQGRFVMLGESSEIFSNATYGFNLSALAYLKMIAKAALNSGLKHSTSHVHAVDVINKKIRSVMLDDQRVIEADLFIDASGDESVLIRQLEQQDNFESWCSWLPCDKKIVMSAPAFKPAPAFSNVRAMSAGWLGYFPLINRTGLCALYSSSHQNLNAVQEEISAITRLKFDDVYESSVKTGMRKQQWIGNCIAVGSSAITFDFLDATQLHALHLGLSFLRTLFPTNKNWENEERIFNEKMQSHAINVRDFQVAHYKLNTRKERFWRERREQEIPKTLKTKLDLFASRGQVSLNENETFQEENWRSLLVGHGLIPQTYNPLVDKIPPKEHAAHFQSMVEYIDYEVQSLPSIEAHVELNSADNEYHSLF